MIINKTNEKILAHNLRICTSIFSKALGLMFSRKIKDFGLVFEFNSEKRVSLHNIFVFYTIDLLFLNSRWEVVELKERFKPFTFYLPKEKARYILELPADTIKQTGTGLGDVVNFK
ncbi:hypothetical protein COV19_06625 [Candidatus Woesearchaeota archaeon CG10_big_fil_rev_8_21_14_0_10_44_13]|nr:MAG: hypothetical protein COV19_06625 [Candidatus Woesearchaeota archaeon CG10_big_fil_rev_8_21_14_0_10_44_13]